MNKKGSGIRVQGSGVVEQVFGLCCSNLATVRFRIIHIHPALGDTEPRTLNPDHTGGMK